MKFQKPQSRAYSKDSLVYFLVGIPMMVLLFFVFPVLFEPSVIRDNGAPKAAVSPQDSIATAAAPLKIARVREAHNYPLFAEYHPGEPEEAAVKDALKPSSEKQSYSYTLKNKGADKARIAIVIDDVGMNRKQSRAVIDISGVPMTLAFLPYAPDLSALTEPALEAGHELLIHMPMEPMNGDIDTGPIALKSGMGKAELGEMLEKAFASFDGYVGINNHMGSRLTQDRAAMDFVMDVLEKRGLFYLDSKTIGSSVAAQAAREQGLEHAERDVFLDHEESLAFARGALRKLEKVALEKGHAIAIGHPKANTVTALKEWLPTLEARGFEIVPVSDLLQTPSESGMAVAELKPKKNFMKRAPKLQDIEPSAGDEVAEDVGAEDLLNAPIGVNEDAIGGLYSLNR